MTVPSFDPTKLLSSLKQVIDNNTEPAKTSGEQPAKQSKSWVSTLIILVVVLAGIAAWAWISWRRGRELAKLRHEQNKAKILKEKAIVDAAIAENDKAIDEYYKKIEKFLEDVRIIEADITAEEARHEADVRAIDSIRSWRDAGIR